ncbi:LapA family protein [Candidatus Marinimicrobia bacterium MT.SAG.2]|nr:LapA family protein [Candidatus Marinimicrobia bacterium MT.SAG.2]
MRLISLFFIVIIVLIIMWFLTQNADQVVKELEIFQYSFEDVDLIKVLFGTFAFGVIMGFLIPVFQYIGAKGEVRRFKKEVKKLRSELNDLRNVGIESELEVEEDLLDDKEAEDDLADDSAGSETEDDNKAQ